MKGIHTISRISLITPITLISLIFIYSFRIFLYFRNISRFPNGTKIRITAKVASEPILYSNSQYLKLSGYKTYLPLYPRIYYGDRITVEGLAEDGKLKNPILINIKGERGLLYAYRQKLISFYERSLPKDHSALVAGVVIGAKSGIGEELWNNFKNSGTAHVVVASGMNVTLVAGFLMGVLVLILPRRKAIPIAFTGIWTYALISGFDAPIVRASVMGSLAFLAVETGRMYYRINSHIY
jgi:hypothetical protein